MKSPDSKKQKSDKRWKHPFLYIFSFIILIIIVVTFVGGPLLSGSGTGSNVVFGRWGGREIKVSPGNYLSRQRDILYEQIRESSRNESYEWQAYNVWKGAYDRTVVRMAALETLERSAAHVSEDRVDQSLLVAGPYMEDGAFSESRFRNTSNSDKNRYRTLVRDDLLHTIFLDDLRHDLMVSTAAKELLRNMALEERSFRFVSFDYASFPDTEVTQFAIENSELFRQIKLSRISVRSSRSESEVIRQQVLNGVATFEDQARNYSTDGFADRGGEMGWRDYHSLRADFQNGEDLDSLYRLGPESLTGVFESDFGFVFYRIDEAAIDPDLEDIDTLNAIRAYLRRFERGLLEDYLLAEAEEFYAAATVSGFSGEARNRTISIQETSSFPINFGGSFFLSQPQIEGEGSSNVLQSATFNERFYSELFSLDEAGSISRPLVLDESVAIFELKEIKEVAEEDVAYLLDNYSFIQQQFLDQDVNEFIYTSDEFEDNFNTVFSELFLN